MAREYDHLFKLLIIGDSGKLAVIVKNLFSVYIHVCGMTLSLSLLAGVGKSSLLLRFADNLFSGES